MSKVRVHRDSLATLKQLEAEFKARALECSLKSAMADNLVTKEFWRGKADSYTEASRTAVFHHRLESERRPQ